MATSIIDQLQQLGVSVRLHGEQLTAGPPEALTPQARDLIHTNRDTLISTLSVVHDTTRDYQDALRAGRLVICARCQNFTAQPNQQPDGQCSLHGATWARVPFQCAQYTARNRP